MNVFFCFLTFCLGVRSLSTQTELSTSSIQGTTGIESGQSKNISDTNNCYPIDSRIDKNLKTSSGRYCYFPFIHENTTYNDCVSFRSSNFKWCPTSCNLDKDKQWDFCLWTKENLKAPGCDKLVNSKINDRVYTNDGVKCYFPFYYKNKCHDDCLKDSREWCIPRPSYDLLKNSNEYTYCINSISSLESKSCQNFTPTVHFQPETSSGFESCYFPFYRQNTNTCYSECVRDANSYYWCSNLPVVEIGNDKFSKCLYLVNIPKYTSLIVHGEYTIQLECSNFTLCGHYAVASSNESKMILTKDPTNYFYSKWEVIPQPQDSVIIRAPVLDSNKYPLRNHWSYKEANVEMAKLVEYSVTDRFVFIRHTNDTFDLKNVKDDKVESGSYLGYRDHEGLNGSLMWSPVPVKWKFTLLKEIVGKEYYTQFQKTTTTTKLSNTQSSGKRLQ